MTSIYDLKTGAIEEFQEWILEIGDELSEQKAFEAIENIVDCSIPVYTTDILNVAKSDLWLASSIPDSFNSTSDITPERLIAYNIYEHLYNELYEWYSENEQ